MSTTIWIILLFGAALTTANFVGARRNTVPATIPWLTATVTALVAINAWFKPGPVWDWGIVALIIITAIACFTRFAAGVAALVVLAVVATISLVGFTGQPTQEPTASASTPAKANIVPASATTPACDAKFVQVAGDNAGNKVDAAFETKLATAMAAAGIPSDAEKATMLENSANNGQRLAIWTSAFGLYADANQWAPLVNGTCLSTEGQTLYNRFDGALSAKGTTFELTDAPASGFNSGVSNGTYGVAGTPGITGNRKAIKVTLADGSVVYVMVRCGNVVHQGKGSLPVVSTDQTKPTPPTVVPPTVTPPKVCLPPHPYGHWPVCKDSPSADPAPRGNAPVGGGRNIDPGPGVFVPPTQMVHPPAAPRVNPPAPVSVAPPVASKPDPAPAPAPEPAAPVPAAPATGTSCAPGITSC